MLLAAGLVNADPTGTAEPGIRIDDPAYLRPQRRIEVEPGRNLNLHCTGHGLPVVVLEAGLGDSSKSWGRVQPALAEQTTTCSYDRAGLGFSDPARRPGSSRNAVDDLHRLLQMAELPAPYVLVGHSYGGMHIRLFAGTYPGDVAGLVFVDPSHADLARGLAVIDPESDRRHWQYVEDLRRCLQPEPYVDEQARRWRELCVGSAPPVYSAELAAVENAQLQTPSRIAAWTSEMSEVWAASAAQVAGAPSAPRGLPIIVLSKSPGAQAANETAEQRQAKNALWARLHDDLAHLSDCGERRVVNASGHYIQLDQPNSVVDSVLQVIARRTRCPADPSSSAPTRPVAASERDR